MKILITGGCGHIASHLWPKLIDLGFSITVVDNMESQRFCSIFGWVGAKGLDLIFEDFRKWNYAESDGFDAVIHLAARTDAESSSDPSRNVAETNYSLTQMAVDVAKHHRAFLVFASSTSVYGVSDGFVTEDDFDVLKPQSPYAKSKIDEEAMILRHVRDHGINAAILRFGTIVGPSMGMRFHTAANKFCLQACMKKPITVWETALHQNRPYLSLDDAAEALIFALTNNDEVRGKIFNVLTQNMSVNDILQIIKLEVDNELNLKFTKSPIMNQFSYNVSGEKLMLQGFKYTDTIANQLRKTISFLKRNATHSNH